MAATNKHAQIRVFPTPDLRDVLFYEINDEIIPKNFDRLYGQPHWDPVRFPNHSLVYISPGEQQRNGEQKEHRWWYAANRNDQDVYNWEHSEADVEGTKFDAVGRTYVIPRDEFNPDSPAMGVAMPDIPTDLFGPGYILGVKKQTRTGERELDSLYVFETRLYIRRVVITEQIAADRELGIGVAKTSTLYYRGELVGGDTIENLFLSPENSFWGINPDGTTVEGRQMSDNWFEVITTSTRDYALEAYIFSIPTVTNLDLPDVLLDVDVVWNKSGSTGNFDSDWEGLATWQPSSDVVSNLSGSESASAESSASIQPELTMDLLSPNGRGIPTTSYFFYMKMTLADTITPSEFIAKVSTLVGSPVSYWPVFKPVSHVIALTGQKVSVTAKASASANVSIRGDNSTGDGYNNKDLNQGTGGSYDISTMNSSTRIPPSIHGPINISPFADSVTATATCNVGWEGSGSGEIIAGENVHFPDVEADSGIKTLTAEGEVTPTFLAATVPSSIPSSGFYIVNSKISPYEAGWAQCFAEVLDASVL